MNRAEHLQWCKDRANKEFEFSGKLEDAFASMMSDLRKHEEEDRAYIEALRLTGMSMQMGGQLNSEAKMFKWIDGFN